MNKTSIEKIGNKIAIIGIILSTILGVVGFLVTIFQPDIRDWIINNLYSIVEKDEIENLTNSITEPTTENAKNTTSIDDIGNEHVQDLPTTTEPYLPEIELSQNINFIKLLKVENDGILFEKNLQILEDTVFYDGYYCEYHEKYQLSNEFNVIDFDGYGITISIPAYNDELSFSTTLTDHNKMPVYETEKLGFISHMGITHDNKILLSFSLTQPIIGEYYCIFSIYNNEVRENIYIKFETT